MRIKIIDDPFDRCIKYNLNYGEFVNMDDPEIIVAKLSILKYRVIKSNDNHYPRGDIITRKDIFLLQL